jgi:hypothetical protein
VTTGDDVDPFPTDDVVDRDLALWGHTNVLELYLQPDVGGKELQSAPHRRRGPQWARLLSQ